MVTADSGVSEISQESSKKEKKQNKKRKRPSLGSAEVENKNNTLGIAMPAESSNESGKAHTAAQNGSTKSVLAQDRKRPNPFAIPSLNTSNITPTSSTSSPKPTVSITSPPTSISEHSPSKRVVQFNGSDSSDESDHAPTIKQKALSKISLGRSNPSPKSLLASPKKISNKDKLLNRKRELEEERRNLPIWTAREPLLKMIEENQVTILLGETGCGKSASSGARGVILSGWSAISRASNSSNNAL